MALTTTGTGTRRRSASAIVLVALLIGTAACSAGSPRPVASTRPSTSPAAIHWAPLLHVAAVVDMTGPRSDGRLTLAAGGRLSLLRPGGPGATAAAVAPEPFARGSDGYSTDPAPEPYLVATAGQRVTGAGCAFGQDTVYALQPTGRAGVTAIDAAGHARRAADLSGVTPNGIALDELGRFGYRLLVTAAGKGGTTVFALDCAGRADTVATQAPTVEGGAAVAPASFGTFAGDLIAPDETSGRIWAFAPDGTHRLVATSPLPHGGDIGAESVGFVPAGFTPAWSAYVADRRSPGNPHPGTDSVLRLSGTDLAAAGVRAGDLLVANEGGALTLDIRCAATCTIRYIADGPAVAHVEGHIVFAPPSPG